MATPTPPTLPPILPTGPSSSSSASSSSSSSLSTSTTSTASTPSTTSTSTTTSTTASTTTSTTSTSSSSTSTSTTSSSSSSSSTLITSLPSTLTATNTQFAPPTDTTVTVPFSGGIDGPNETQAASNTSSSSKPFFKNTAAVAGVFSVVGLIGLVLVIALATNAIRRRRAKRFDADVAAAAAEAAAISNYPFDDDDARGGGFGYKSTYSDPESHGTLSQSPMSHGDSYNMAEYPGYGQPTTYNAMPSRGYGDYPGGGAGIAGFGASEAATHREPVGGRAPYGAFATPGGPAPGDVFAAGGPYPMSGLDAAGIGAAGAAGVGSTYLNRGPSQNAGTMLTRGPSNAASRSLSLDNASGGRGPSSNGHETYAAHYQTNFQPEQHQYVPQPAHNQYVVGAGGAAASDGRLAPPVDDDALTNPFSPTASAKGFDVDENEEAYGGTDSYEPASRPELHADESRLSIRDEDDYGRAGRTLKIANV